MKYNIANEDADLASFDTGLVEVMSEGVYEFDRRSRPSWPPWEACFAEFRNGYRREVRASLLFARLAGWEMVRR